MSAARSAPSGPAITPEGGSPTLGYLATATVAAGASTDCAVANVPAAGGSFLVSAACQAAAASATTTARFQVIFTPTSTGVPVVLFTVSRASVPTSPEPFRLLSLIAKVLEAGSLAVKLGNTGAQQLDATDVDCTIQPLTITT